MALCPVHGDTHRSLSVSYDGGKTLLHCFSCQADFRDITTALGLTPEDLFDKPLKRDTTKPPTKPTRAKKTPLPKPITQPHTEDPSDLKWKHITTYAYIDLNGSPVQEVIREEAHDEAGKRHKRFTQRFYNAATRRWVKRRPESFEPVLYNAAAVFHAIANGRPVWIVEGEKDADTAIEVGLVATTNAQGALNFPTELVSALAGGLLSVVVDRDAAGYTRAEALAVQLTEVAKEIKFYAPALTDDKADLTDHFEAGFGVTELIELSRADVAALAQAAEAKKAAARVSACLTEATAQFDIGNSEAVERWAAEAATRWERVADLTDRIPATEALSEEGKNAAQELGHIRSAARNTAQETFTLAGVEPPVTLLEPVRPVISISDDSGANDAFYGFRTDSDPTPNAITTYAVRDGQTVIVNESQDRTTYKVILDGWVDVEAVYVEDDGTDPEHTLPTHSIKALVSRWKRNTAGTPILENGKPVVETCRITWNQEQILNGAWFQSLPWPAMATDSSRRGRDRLWDAIFRARPVPTNRETLHTTVGWRNTENGDRYFVHGAGAITKNGHLNDLNISLGDTIKPKYQLPEPTTDAAQLRAAWAAGTNSLLKLPARVIAPLLGYVWAAPTRKTPILMHLYGGRGSFKTSAARAAVNFFSPELTQADPHLRETISASNQGGTSLGLTRALGRIGNLPVLVDDAAPGEDPRKAKEKIESIARMLYNGTARTVASRTGGIKSERPIDCSPITTGEINITGSGLTRMFSIPIDPGDICGEADARTVFGPIDNAEARHARGIIGA